MPSALPALRRVPYASACCCLAPVSPQLELDLLDEGGELAATKSRYVVAELPVRLPMVPRQPTDKPNPKLGVGEWAAGRQLVLLRAVLVPQAGACAQLGQGCLTGPPALPPPFFRV